VRINEELGDRLGVGILLSRIGNLHQASGEYGEALQRYEQSLRIAGELGDRAQVSGSLHEIGMLHHRRSEYGKALQRYEQSLRIAEEVGNRPQVASSLHQIGMLYQDRGEYGEALQRYEQSLRIKEELGDRAGVARSLGQIGNLLTETERYEEAFTSLLNALVIFRQLQSPYAEHAVNDLSTLRARWSEQAFDAAWRAATNEDAPEQLRKASHTSSKPLYVSTPHPRYDPKLAFQLNLQYQQELAQWQKLPWWQRIRKKKPRPPLTQSRSWSSSRSTHSKLFAKHTATFSARGSRLANIYSGGITDEQKDQSPVQWAGATHQRNRPRTAARSDLRG
jgi:tetratricopeptide (TPR) repeat protein